jgi:hypothetical protein
VREVEVQGTQRVLDDGPVPGPHGGDLLRLGKRVQPAQGVQVGTEPAVGVGHDGRAPAEHRVTGQHRTLGWQHERQRVGGVSRRPDHADLQAVHVHDIALTEALVAEPVSRVESTDAAAHPLRERPRGLGVVEVPVREQYDGHLAGP